MVITETMQHVRSVSIGLWVRNGSRGEVPQENGLAHFIEHMVFKGTERRSAEALPAKWIRSAECWTPLLPKNKSALTPKFWTSICPSRSM